MHCCYQLVAGCLSLPLAQGTHGETCAEVAIVFHIMSSSSRAEGAVNRVDICWRHISRFVLFINARALWDIFDPSSSVHWDRGLAGIWKFAGCSGRRLCLLTSVCGTLKDRNLEAKSIHKATNSSLSKYWSEYDYDNQVWRKITLRCILLICLWYWRHLWDL